MEIRRKSNGATMSGLSAATRRDRPLQRQHHRLMKNPPARVGRKGRAARSTPSTRDRILKSSIDLQIDQDNDRISATVSSNSRYASVHEYGFVGTVAVKASLRRITEAFGHPISEKTINVGPYRRRMELPERSFMRSALEDMDPAIRDEVEAALLEALTV